MSTLGLGAPTRNQPANGGPVEMVEGPQQSPCRPRPAARSACPCVTLWWELGLFLINYQQLHCKAIYCRQKRPRLRLGRPRKSPILYDAAGFRANQEKDPRFPVRPRRRFPGYNLGLQSRHGLRVSERHAGEVWCPFLLPARLPPAAHAEIPQIATDFLIVAWSAPRVARTSAARRTRMIAPPLR